MFFAVNVKRRKINVSGDDFQMSRQFVIVTIPKRKHFIPWSPHGSEKVDQHANRAKREIVRNNYE